VHYFILSGTPQWERFFFDEPMLAALAGATRAPVPLVDGLRDARGYVVALAHPLLAARAGQGTVSARAIPVALPEVAPLPPPEPFRRRRLLADAAPGASTPRTQPEGPAQAPWTPLAPGAPPAAGLRSSSAYLGSHFSVQLEVAPPAAGEPLAIQFAETDLFAPPGGNGSAATGFALLWDGEQWRLQYHRDRALAADLPLAAVAPVGGDVVGALDDSVAVGQAQTIGSMGALGIPEDQTDHNSRGHWYRVEIALEPRSAAAWVWPRGDPQPDQPNAVFAPPEAAATDGARPRALLLPAHAVVSVILEGGTRDP
jgi:hypothetical protein